MTESELQALSRAVAEKLPTGYAWDGYCMPKFFGRIPALRWLHESTEACAEIMVRVLLHKGVTIKPHFTPYLEGPYRFDAVLFTLTGDTVEIGGTRKVVGADCMLAFRVAVLKAAKSVLGGIA